MKKHKKSLKTSFLLMTILPIITMGLLIASLCGIGFRSVVELEINDAMKDMAYVVSNTLDNKYPGDYTFAESDKYAALQKGGEFVQIDEYLQNIKEDTELDFTIFYGNIRVVTTLTDTDGDSVAGSKVNQIIEKEVIEDKTSKFYRSVDVGQKEYYAFYLPLTNADGTVVGMIAVLEDSESVKAIINQCIIIVFGIAIVVSALAGFLSVMYSQKFIVHFEAIKRYLNSIKQEKNNVTLDYKLTSREDELGEMANAAVEMRRSIKKLTERDSLTGIYNRRYAGIKLDTIIENTDKSGADFAVAIGDIDYFKKVNDTYGHLAGDAVLIAVSDLLKKCMVGKGFVARWGGEEFILVFDKIDAKKSVGELNEIKSKIQKLSIPYNNNNIKVTMSFGVCNGKGYELNDIIRSADERLYIAKDSGRNRVISSSKNKSDKKI